MTIGSDVFQVTPIRPIGRGVHRSAGRGRVGRQVDSFRDANIGGKHGQAMHMFDFQAIRGL